MLAITIVLFVVPHNQQIMTIRQFFTCRIPLFRNQNLNILEKAEYSLMRSGQSIKEFAENNLKELGEMYK